MIPIRRKKILHLFSIFILGESEFFLWSSFRQIVDECPHPLQADQLHFGPNELIVGVNVSSFDLGFAL